MPGLCGLLNHSLERSLRPLPSDWPDSWLLASCPLVRFFFIGFYRNANSRNPFGLLLLPCAKSLRLQTRWRWLRASRLGHSTLVQEFWLRYHFILFGASPSSGRGGLSSSAPNFGAS